MNAANPTSTPDPTSPFAQENTDTKLYHINPGPASDPTTPIPQDSNDLPPPLPAPTKPPDIESLTPPPAHPRQNNFLDRVFRTVLHSVWTKRLIGFLTGYVLSVAWQWWRFGWRPWGWAGGVQEEEWCRGRGG